MTPRLPAVIPEGEEAAPLTGMTAEALRLAVRAFDDLDVETVVRFGSPSRELMLEVEAFTPTLVALFVPREAGPLTRWRIRTLRRQVTSRVGVRVLVVATDWSRWSPPSQARPALSWQDVVVGGPYY